jgi:exosortase/archaeosortase family protein
MKTPNSLFTDKKFWAYLVKFTVVFCLCYFGTLAVIGIAAPGGLHSTFVEKHLDYVTWIKDSLIWATGLILSVFHIATYTAPEHIIRFVNGNGVHIAMDCVGYGVYSFWIAFVAANRGKWVKKLIWIIGGLFGLWFINVVRITLYLTSLNRDWSLPFGIDHHTWFNIFAYLLIFALIFFYDRSFSGHSTHKKNKNSFQETIN